MSVLTLQVDEVMRTLSNDGQYPFVVNDKTVDIVRFALNTGFTDVVLDEYSALRVMYQRPGETQVRAQTLTYYDTDGLHNYYDWQLLSADLAEKGALTVALCILRTDGDVEEWHTTPCQIRVLNTIHTDDSDEADETITPTVAQRVAILESMIQRVASGAPIVVSSMSAMTDTDQIYVLSTDRKWYYHNGSAWTVGGEYGGVAAGSITTDKLADGAITTAKIANGAITSEKLSNDITFGTDKTLSISGMPADAKVVGDEIADLKSALASALPTASASGAVASFTDGANNVPVDDLKISIEPKQEGSGDPSPDNVRPISGWTGATVTRAGKNLYSRELSQYNVPVYATDGTSASYPEVAAWWIKVKPNTQYTLTLKNSTYDYYVGVIYCGSNKSFISRIMINGRDDFSYTITTPANCQWLEIAVNQYDVNNLNKNDWEMQIEEGSVATEYEPCSAQTYPITFPSSAGMVYGGTLDVTTGVLTVGRTMKAVKDMAWSRTTSYAHPVFYVNQSGKAFSYQNGACSFLRDIGRSSIVSAKNFADNAENGDFALGSNNTQIYVRYDDITDVSTFKTQFADETFVYPITTPVTYQLTPTEVRTLLGNNNIWADTGDTEVAYRADTTRYIDLRINAQQKLISGVETSYTATKNYAIGDYVIVNDTLYKVTAAIASGATITPGTNCVATTVAEQLILLANA